MHFNIGQEVAGYIILERVQHSHLGMVYRVQHRTLESQHYLKCANKKSLSTASLRDSYISAMTQLSALRHPSLVRLTDVVVSESECGIVMDWVEGHDIIRMLADDISYAQLGQWICQALCGLQFLHENDILHLRIHPKNIHVEVERNGSLEGRLMDGGYPLNLPEPRTFHYYRAPECWGEAPQPTAQSDVFSIMVVFYELLCDARPFQGSTPTEVLDAMLSGEFISPRKHNNRIPSKLEHVIKKALSPFATDRYESAKALFDALQKALGKDGLVDYDTLREEAETIEPATFQDVSSVIQEPEPEPEIEVEEIPEGLKFKHNPDTIIIDIIDEDDEEANETQRKTASKSVLKVPPLWKVCLSLALMALVILYLFFPRNRNVVLMINDKPTWGEVRLKLNDKNVRIGNGVLSNTPYGNYTLQWAGGVFESGECKRCCWESQGELTVNFGIGELTVPMDLFPEVEPMCPTEMSEYEFSLIPAGQFTMGSSLEEKGRDLDEIQHNVTLSKPLLVGQSEVTQQLYELVTQKNPSQNRSPRHPVETVSWDDAVMFCNVLSEMEGLTPCYDLSSRYIFMTPGPHCEGYRLPTEAEWEYAAVASQNTKYSGSDTVDAIAWIFTNSNQKSQPVKSKASNLWGLYDMSGNIQEWVWNNYIPYSVDDNFDPIGPADGTYRSLRGGGYTHNPRRTRVHDRDKAVPRLRTPYIGFRIVRSVNQADD